MKERNSDHPWRLQRAALGPDALALAQQLSAVLRDAPAYRRSGIHNPWHRAAAGHDAWALLAIAEQTPVRAALGSALGADVVLWDMRIGAPVMLAVGPDDAPGGVPMYSEAGLWPLPADSGAVAWLALAGATLPVALPDGDGPAGSCSFSLQAGDLLVLPADARWPDPGALEDFLSLACLSGRARFERDPGHPAHRAMAARDPLINHANAALWLLQGQDHAGNDYARGFSSAVAQWADG